MANFRRLAELGMAPLLAKEVAAAIDAGTVSATAVRRLTEMGMVPRHVRELRAQLATPALRIAKRWTELGLAPRLAVELTTQIGGGGSAPAITGAQLTAGQPASGQTLTNVPATGAITLLINGAASGLTVPTTGTTRAISGTPAAAGALTLTGAVSAAVGTVGAAISIRLATGGTEDPSALAALGSGNTLAQYRTRHVVQNDTTSLLFDEPLFYVNATTDQFADVANPLPAGAVLNAALEIETAAAGTPSAQFLPFAFGGAATYTATGSETNWISSDALPSSAFGLSKFTKGDVLWIRRAILFPTANPSWLCNDASDATNPTSGESARGATDNSFNRANGTGAFTGTAGTALASSRFLRPMSVRGPHSGVAIKGMHNSIGHGKGNNRNGDGSNTTTPGGPFRRAAHLAGFPYQKSGRDGQRINNFTPAKAPVRFAQIAAGHYTHIWGTAGTNDLNVVSAATALASLDTFIAAAKSAKSDIRIVWDNVLARVRDTAQNTDAYATLAGQQVQGINTAMQFGPNPAAGTGTDTVALFRQGLADRMTSGALVATTNANAGWSDPSQTYLVRVNGSANYFTTDGTHQTLAAANSTSDALATEIPSKFNLNP